MRFPRALVAALALCVLAAASPALAKKQQQPQNIDFWAVTCKELVAEMATGDEQGAALAIMWLAGYLNGVSGNTTLNWKTLEGFTGFLLDNCSKNPAKKVLDVAKEVGIN